MTGLELSGRGQVRARARVTSGERNGSSGLVEAVAVFAFNTAPIVAHPIADQSPTYGAAFSFPVPANTFSDVDAGQTLAYTASGLPAWLSFDANTRTFSGTPIALGSSTITVTATDSGSPALSASTTFGVVVGKAALTVTADTFTRFYGEANPPLTGTLVGVVNGDNITASYSTTATPTGSAGVYTIYVRGPRSFQLPVQLLAAGDAEHLVLASFLLRAPANGQFELGSFRRRLFPSGSWF